MKSRCRHTRAPGRTAAGSSTSPRFRRGPRTRRAADACSVAVDLSDCVQELGSELWSVLVVAAPVGGPRPGMALAHTAHLSAQMRRVQVNCDTMRLEHAHQLVRDLHADALLHSEAAGEDPDEPGQLGDGDDLLLRGVADVSVPLGRERMVLAQREELEWTPSDPGDT